MSEGNNNDSALRQSMTRAPIANHTDLLVWKFPETGLSTNLGSVPDASRFHDRQAEVKRMQMKAQFSNAPKTLRNTVLED